MILIFQSICLFITMYVLRQYVVSGLSSRKHRLLPLVLGFIGVYNFFEIIGHITRERMLFDRLDDLLLLHILYLLIFYMMEVLDIGIPRYAEQLLFVSLILMDTAVILLFEEPEAYGPYYLTYIGVCVLLILVFGTYAYVRYTYSMREHRVTNLLYLALLIPTASMGIHTFLAKDNLVIAPAGLVFACMVILHLISTDQMVDAEAILKENLFDTSEVAVILFDADYYYLEANAAAKRIFPDKLDVPARRRKAGKYLEAVRSIPTGVDSRWEMTVHGKNLEYQLLPVFYHNRLWGHVMHIIDITKQKRETQLMAGLKLAAENQTLEKSRFLAQMGHDLRSPLHAIIGISEILGEKQELSARNRLLARHIGHAGNTLLEQVNLILDYSKLEAGRLELEKRRYTLERIVEELARNCIINLQSKPVELSVQILDEHPAELIGDELRVREIIQNLLSNAVKFTKKGEIRCEIRCRTDGRNIFFTCSVIDSGPGMSREKLAHIFEEYVSYAGETSAEGAGLGLCIVRQLTERMGGSVSAESDGVHGTTFVASFYQEAATDAVCPPVSYTRQSLMRPSKAAGRVMRPGWVYPEARVLVADDMKINQEIFREISLPWQFEVCFVSNGREAVEAVKNQEFQLIFLDMLMPQMSGTEAAGEIASFVKTPLILLTANLADDVKQECAQAGFADFLTKPICMAEFQRIAETYLPKEYRRHPQHTGEYLSEEYKNSMQTYRRTLEVFAEEFGPLAELLPVYADEERGKFRIKVHGIKGAARQLGRYELAESAEVMEMAAKTENDDYIRRHLERFTEEIREAVEEVRLELFHIPMEQTERNETDVKKVFQGLLKGFDAYDIRQIETQLEILRQIELGEREQELFAAAEAACSDLEYERGSELLSEFAE